MDIPFKKYDTEVKPLLSGVDAAMDLENLRSSFEIASLKIIEIIGQSVWNMAMAHYNSDNYELVPVEADPPIEATPEIYAKLDLLVHGIQKVLANLGFYDHIPFLAVRISNDSITRREADNEKTAYKSQVDDIRETLIKTAWNYFDLLIKYLNDTATKYTEWSAGTAYLSGSIIYQPDDALFYECNTQHTSTDSFTDDLANWTELDKDVDIIFWQWTQSDEYVCAKETLFESYKEYNRIININNSNYVFMTLAPIINEIIFNDIEPALELTTIRNQLKFNNLTDENKVIIALIRRFLAHKSFAEALVTMDYNIIPEPYRKLVDNEMTKQNKSQAELNAREKLSGQFRLKADAYYKKFTNFLDTRKEIAQQTQTDNYTFMDYPNIVLNANDKFLATV
jgi:hypothetical protein